MKKFNKKEKLTTLESLVVYLSSVIFLYISFDSIIFKKITEINPRVAFLSIECWYI